MALQFRRGTDAERQQFEFAEGEPVYVTDTGELYIGDGETQGGRRVLSSLSEESDPELGGNLDLNDNNIVGIGNIAIDGNLSVSGLGQSLDLNGYNIIGQGNIIIDGTINATGDINLGDGAEDNVIVGGQISSPLVPAEDGLYDLGSDSLRWRNGYFEGVDIAGEISVDTISVTRIIDQDSSVLYDSNTGTFTGDGSGLTNLAINEYSIFDLNGAFTSTSPNRGDLLIFDGFNFTPQQIRQIEGADSTVIVDATTNTFTGTFIGDGFFEGLEVDTIYSTDNTVLWESSSNELQADLRGSVYSQDSGIIVNSQTGDISATDISAELVSSDIIGAVFSNDGEVIVDSVTREIFSTRNNISNLDDVSTVTLTRQSDSDLSGSTNPYGSLLFNKDDVNGTETLSYIRGGENYITLGAGLDTEQAIQTGKRITLFDGNFGIGIVPTSKLDVDGNAFVRGTMQLEVLDVEPTNPLSGTIAIADGTNWNPVGSGTESIVVYLNGAWQSLT